MAYITEHIVRKALGDVEGIYNLSLGEATEIAEMVAEKLGYGPYEAHTDEDMQKFVESFHEVWTGCHKHGPASCSSRARIFRDGGYVSCALCGMVTSKADGGRLMGDDTWVICEDCLFETSD